MIAGNNLRIHDSISQKKRAEYSALFIQFDILFCHHQGLTVVGNLTSDFSILIKIIN